ncbi:MAG: Fic family protein [Coriobacteriales bacterium]|nr:Fic family protein [Coriobacteriales bacterium]
MRRIDYIESPRALLTPDVVALLTSIHEHKGKQELFIEAHADALATLVKVARIQSTGASNRIEGVNTTDKRLAELVRDKSAPRDRTEQEIAGYRDALALIHESYDYLRPRPRDILQLHRLLYSFSASSQGGVYKSHDNFIAEVDTIGIESVRFKPVPADQTPHAMDSLCDKFIQAEDNGTYDPLILIPMFILDFLCIHPFNDGNGRMSRLLTLLLLYRAGYLVGKYVSIEKLIESSKETYYEALQASSVGWHRNCNDNLPFVRYCLGIVHKASGEFERRVEHVGQKGLSKPDRVAAVIDQRIGTFTKREVMELCPDISQVTVERTLAELMRQGRLVKVGGGRSAAYARAGTVH